MQAMFYSMTNGLVRDAGGKNARRGEERRGEERRGEERRGEERRGEERRGEERRGEEITRTEQFGIWRVGKRNMRWKYEEFILAKRGAMMREGRREGFVYRHGIERNSSTSL
eukprot:766265-Hanusia_phi.AAC.2